MVTKIHAELREGDAEIRMEGNQADIINLAIQIAESTIADMPKFVQPLVIKRVQDSIPAAVKMDAKAMRRNSEKEEWQQPKETGTEEKEKSTFRRTQGFYMATELAKNDPNFVKFLREILNSIDGE